MSGIQSTNHVREYPENDEDYRTVTIRNHWKSKDKVVLSLPEIKTEFVFIAQDLIMAISNSQNCHREEPKK